MLGIEKVNQVIKIVPEAVELACSANVDEICEDYIVVSLLKTNAQLSGRVECFSVVEDGILYFVSNIENIGNGMYKLSGSDNFTTLQRRQYTRISHSQDLTLKDNDTLIEVKTTDLSAGGMRILSPTELSLSNDYDFTLELDKSTIITAKFSPIRADKMSDGMFAISGKFKLITNRARISLVQYCFRVKMESTNK